MSDNEASDQAWHDINRVERDWKSAPTWHDIIRLERDFIELSSQGLECNTIYRSCGWDKELVTYLQTFNNQGILTIDARADKRTWSHTVRSGETREYMFEPYIIFLLGETSINKQEFLQSLCDDSDLDMISVRLSSGRYIANCSKIVSTRVKRGHNADYIDDEVLVDHWLSPSEFNLDIPAVVTCDPLVCAVGSRKRVHILDTINKHVLALATEVK
jgi:hypothetical protein